MGFVENDGHYFDMKKNSIAFPYMFFIPSSIFDFFYSISIVVEFEKKQNLRVVMDFQKNKKKFPILLDYRHPKKKKKKNFRFLLAPIIIIEFLIF